MLMLILMTALAPMESAGEKAQEIKVYANRPAGMFRKTQVLRTVDELNKAIPVGGKTYKITKVLAGLLKVNSVDLEKQMVIVVYAGEKRTGGYSVEVKSLEVKDKKLIVHWKLNSPGPDDIVTQAITHPQLVLLVDRFDGEVVFDPPVPKK
ncbi:MAG TPA: protease complex subunit PrcB family protein [Gemmataceae bacterium]|nr:protease complex subunit PrcB family protein [Gemmataceae bacterium]